MGLVMWWRRKRMSDPVDGSLVVTVCAQPATLLMGVVSTPGFPAQAVELHGTVPAKRRPTSEQRIPVLVDHANPARIAIKWNQVPVRKPLGQARSHTQALAASMLRHTDRTRPVTINHSL